MSSSLFFNANNQICIRPDNHIHPFFGKNSIRKTQSKTCANPSCFRPCHVDLTGTQYSCCGKTCARAIANLAPSLPKCANTNCNKTVYVNSQGQRFHFCGITCARIHRNSGPNCIRIGCDRKAYLNPTDRTKSHSFCSIGCFWTDCSKLTQTKLTLLCPNQIDYENAYKRFTQTLPNSTVKAIFRLQMPKSIVDKHLALKKEMSGTTDTDTNRITQRMFHGTKTSCDPTSLMTTLRPSCAAGNCGVCGILREGNKSAYSKREGGRMWFAKNAAVSLGYCDGKQVKTMFMVDVLAKQRNDIVIVSKDEETLPRFLIIFQ
ncbi:9648_t:CDS:2 [Ambispora gerdemannii]|uniref:9648_t:CDS:1 n=1 Tax=Ambispora gerdemannii TaxID=144530 RepID=A0A9N9A9A0_9GLOM|nr:9648_t:CDS:2 [Ambispora gerdemannii]